MSTVTRQRPEAAPVTERLHGVYWLAWRQSRILLLTLAAAVVLGTAWFLIRHGEMADDLALVRGLPGCLTLGNGGLPCIHAQLGLMGNQHQYSTYVEPMLAAIPLLVGMFVGAPLLAQEFERGTGRLVWGQSVSRTRWLAARLAVPGSAIALGAGVLAVFSTWYVRFGTLRGVFGSPFEPGVYQTVGLVPIAMALFAFAFGVAVGILVRRVLVAVALTGGLLLALNLALYELRPHLYPMVLVTTVGPADGYRYNVPDNAWPVAFGKLGADGTRFPDTEACDARACVDSHTFYGQYHPVSHFVPLQLVESGLLLVLAAALVAFVFRRMRAGLD